MVAIAGCGASHSLVGVTPATSEGSSAVKKAVLRFDPSSLTLTYHAKKNAMTTVWSSTPWFVVKVTCPSEIGNEFGGSGEKNGVLYEQWYFYTTSRKRVSCKIEISMQDYAKQKATLSIRVK